MGKKSRKILLKYQDKDALFVGDRIMPKTEAGLELSTIPCNGKKDQKREVSCVFIDVGIVLRTQAILIDYGSWGGRYEGLGKVPYQNCLIKCKAGIGWTGAGAVFK